ncbi:MAG: small conductance mechanosensitive channel [Lentimonas sp.]|jgi:small conductance mechanosensitive channel
MTLLLNVLELIGPLAATFIISVLILIAIDKLMRARARSHQIQNNFARHITMIALTAVSLIAVILTLPINDEMKGQLFSLMSVALTVVVALSSTTIVSNAMAGIMSRAIGSFKVGDFVKSEEHFGRITERGLFHTEIQTEDRDLITVPNLYLMTNPFRVVQSSGTVVSATVSLGYDVDHSDIKPKLIEAANAIELEEPFVRILELGDFAVSYRIAGFLSEVTQLVSARSKLNQAVLDSLHQAGIEIASPNIMAQRPMPDGQQFIPQKTKGQRPSVESTPAPDERIFDKAERAAEKERLSAEHDQISTELEVMEKEAKGAETEPPSLALHRRRLQAIQRKLELMKSAEAET